MRGAREAMTPNLTDRDRAEDAPQVNPVDRVRELIHEAKNHFPELDESAETLASDLAVTGHEPFFGPEEVPLSVLIPSFITSELKTAFQIGFLIFIPFLVIDLVVASVLMSMGMMMLSPMLISLPFKIMLFVLVDGWTLLVGTLAASFFA